MLTLRRLAGLALGLAACTSPMTDLAPDVRAELIPTGELRLAVAVGPAASATFAVEDPATGELRGPTITLGTALADRLGVPIRLVIYRNSGEIATAGDRDEWDVTFVPVDAARAEVIDFGPEYSLFDSTFLVRAGLDVDTIAELDATGRVVGAVDNTTTARAAERTLEQAEIETHASVEELRTLLADGAIDAVALSRLSLTTLARDLPGTRILDEAFHSTATAIAVPKGRAAALVYVTGFIEDAKSSGLARRALDDAGLEAARVAPPAAP
jgi:polar amino acid transport system substrate-binding protein